MFPSDNVCQNPRNPNNSADRIGRIQKPNNSQTNSVNAAEFSRLCMPPGLDVRCLLVVVC